MGEETHEGAGLSPAELERAGRAALGRPVTAQASASRIEKEVTDRVTSEAESKHQHERKHHGNGHGADGHAGKGDGAKGGSGGGKPNRSADEIEREIEQARTQLASTLDEIVDRVKPANVARRSADSVRAQFVDPDTGKPRLERIVPVAGGVFGVIALVVVLKRRGRGKG